MLVPQNLKEKFPYFFKISYLFYVLPAKKNFLSLAIARGVSSTNHIFSLLNFKFFSGLLLDQRAGKKK